MNLLDDLESSAMRPQRIIGMLVILIAMILAGMWMGARMTRGHYEPLLAEAHKQIGTLTTANAAMKASVEHQNTAIAALQAEGQKRQQAAEAAVQKAQKRAGQYQARAQALLKLAAPAGRDECEAAQASFDAELKEERSVK